MNEDQLYRRYLSGDASAGDQLMLRLGDALTAYLNAFLHHPQDAEDMMLDCFAAILVNKPAIGDGHFRAYLFKMARNKANRLWRLRLRRPSFSMDESLLPGNEAPDDALLKGEMRAALERCLNRIAPQYREALYLVYDLEMSYAQASQVMACDTTRIENLLKKGKAQMRRELEKEGITHADL